MKTKKSACHGQMLFQNNFMFTNQSNPQNGSVRYDYYPCFISGETEEPGGKKFAQGLVAGVARAGTQTQAVRPENHRTAFRVLTDCSVDGSKGDEDKDSDDSRVRRHYLSNAWLYISMFTQAARTTTQGVGDVMPTLQISKSELSERW